MKHKIGDKVKVKNLDWYNENKRADGSICTENYYFCKEMSDYLGKEAVITDINVCDYEIDIDNGRWFWNDEMFEEDSNINNNTEEENKKLKEEEFEKVARPVIKFLKENFHPHSTVIITPTSAEIVEGLMGFED